MSGNILNSNGVHVAVVNNGGVFDLDGRKLYDLKGINIYRLSGELVGHLNNGQGTKKRLDRSTDKLFPCRREISTPAPAAATDDGKSLLNVLQQPLPNNLAVRNTLQRLRHRDLRPKTNLIAKGAGETIPIKSTHRTITEMQDLEAMAAKLLETARKLPERPMRRGILKEIGKFGARITALKAKK